MRGASLRVAALAAGFAALISPGVGHAITSCTISATAHAFGNYDVFLGTALDTTSTITIRCFGANGTITVTLSKGASGNYAQRTMLLGPDTLNYNLYFNTARTQIWGDGTGGTVVWTRTTGGGTVRTRTVYGRVPAGQDVRVGTYADTIVATILW